MKKCFFILSFICVPYITAMNYDFNQKLNINEDKYNKLKIAVFAKAGPKFANKFDQKYPNPCKDSIELLAEQFDEGSCHKPLETDPPKIEAYIDRKRFLLACDMVPITYNHLRQLRSIRSNSAI